MKIKLIKILSIPLLLILVFAFTNPSINRFKEFKGVINGNSEYRLKRESNYIFFSVYECNGEQYVGLLMNFYKKGSASNDESQNSHLPTLDDAKIDTDLISLNPVYKTKDSQIVTRSQLIHSGYDIVRINKGVYNGILTPLPIDSLNETPKIKVWLMLEKSSIEQMPYDSFETTYSTKEKINSLYYGLKEDRLYSKTMNDFYSQYFSQ